MIKIQQHERIRKSLQGKSHGFVTDRFLAERCGPSSSARLPRATLAPEDDASLHRLAEGGEEEDNNGPEQASGILQPNMARSTPRALLDIQLQQYSVGVDSLPVPYPHKNDAAS